MVQFAQGIPQGKAAATSFFKEVTLMEPIYIIAIMYLLLELIREIRK